MDERYLTSFEDQTTALGYTSGDTTLVSPQVSLVGADEVVYSKEIPNESRIRFAKDEATGKLYFVVDVVDSPYVTFTAEEDGSSIGLEALSIRQTLEYSMDTTTWNAFNITDIMTTNIPLNNGDKVYIRGILSSDNTDGDNIVFFTQFKMSGKISASGNCNAIWNYQDLNAPLKKYCGYHMFDGCTSLTTAPKLPATELSVGCYNHMFNDCSSLTTAPELPSTMLVDHCYQYMFYGCTSLTTAPVLPATTLAYNCYYCMFYGCTSLTTAPELPATTLADGCYNSMFTNCTSLATAPELPATTLSEYCYSSMFQGCSALTTAPELPATMLVNGCYNRMFYRCKLVNYIKCLATSVSASSYTTNWVSGVASTGTFVKHPSLVDSGINWYWATGRNGIPSGWVVEDAILAE